MSRPRCDGWSANVGRDPAWWLGTIVAASAVAGAVIGKAVGVLVHRHRSP